MEKLAPTRAAVTVLALHRVVVVARTTKKYVPVVDEMPSTAAPWVAVMSTMPQQSFVPLAKAVRVRTLPAPLTLVLTMCGPVEAPALA